MHAVRPPPVAATSRRLRLEASALNASADGTIRRVHVRVVGPSHMALVLEEGRLMRWSLAPGTPPPRRPPLAPRERIVFAFCTAEAPSPDANARDADEPPRVWELWLEVSGPQPLELAAYAHYLAGADALSPELAALERRLPPAASRGAWHWMVSMIARRTVAVR